MSSGCTTVHPTCYSGFILVIYWCTLLVEVGKAQLNAQSATSATSVIAEVALHFNFLFLTIAKVALWTKVFKICCALIALRFQNFFG